MFVFKIAHENVNTYYWKQLSFLANVTDCNILLNSLFNSDESKIGCKQHVMLILGDVRKDLVGDAEKKEIRLRLL